MHTVKGTKEIGKRFIELDVVDSTNNYAAEQLSLSQVQHGTVILAHEQSAGRGQRERKWRSEAHRDLTFSVVLLPKALPVDRQFVLVKLSALAVRDVVAGELEWGTGPRAEDVRIKWPNDILVERRKVCGILIRTEVQGDKVASAVVGMGLNVNSTELSAELGATSLYMLTGHWTERLPLLDKVLQRFEHYWELFLAGDRAWEEQYRNALYARGRWADLELDGRPHRGRPMDVDDMGRLLVEEEGGGVKAYGHERLRFPMH